MQTARKKNISVIPSQPEYDRSIKVQFKMLRVAAYCRVSTTLEQQESSYEAQVSYYTEKIQSNPNWKLAGIYADDGKSATNTKKRDDFNTMIDDCMAGKIDLVITKSVSRFARNTVDSLTTVRQLKEKGIEIYFEKENIWTLDSKGELLITIMSSLAQEESRSISENVTWGQRKRFADGKVTVPFGHFLGYDRGEDGNLVLNPKEAVIIQRIFSMFLQGMTPYGIAKQLTADGILSPAKKDKWNAGTIKRILTNEKYKGDALLQKSYTVDFLTKKKKANEGEIPQYYVENNHEAIIEPAVFDLAQNELEKRNPANNRHSGVHTFSGKIKCGACGSWYGSKVWHSNSKYRRTVWQCNHKFNGQEKCSTPHLDEDTIKELFVKAANKLLEDKDEIIANFESMKDVLYDTGPLETKQTELQNEMEIITELIQQCINENANVALDQGEYQRRYDGLVQRFDTTKEDLEKVSGQIKEKVTRRQTMAAFLDELKKQDELLTDFDQLLWHSLVDYIIVFEKDKVQVNFKNGITI